MCCTFKVFVLLIFLNRCRCGCPELAGSVTPRKKFLIYSNYAWKTDALMENARWNRFPRVPIQTQFLITRRARRRLGSLSKDVFERRTSTGSEAFFSFICLDSNKFVLLSFFSLIKTICPRVWTNPPPNDAKSPLPVDVRRSKTLLLKLSTNKATTTVEATTMSKKHQNSTSASAAHFFVHFFAFSTRLPCKNP